MSQKIIVSFSGGVDSTAVLFNLLEQGFECIPVYFRWRLCDVGIKEVKIINKFYEKYKDKYPLFHKPEVHFESEVYKTIDTKQNIGSRNRIFLNWLIDRCTKENINGIGMGEYIGGGKESWVYWWGPSSDDCDTNSLQEYINKNSPNYKIKLWTLDDFGKATLKNNRVDIGKKILGEDMFMTTCCGKGHGGIDDGTCYLCQERHVAMLTSFGYDKTVYLKDPKEGIYFVEYSVQMGYLDGLLWTLKNKPENIRIPKLEIIKRIKELQNGNK